MGPEVEQVQATSGMPPSFVADESARRGRRLGASLAVAIALCLVAVTARLVQVRRDRAASAAAALGGRNGDRGASLGQRLIHAQPIQFTPNPVFEGTLEADQESDLAFAVGGRLTAVEKHVGDCVTSGSVLARLDANGANTRLSVAAAESAVAAARERGAVDSDVRTQSLSRSGAIAAAEVVRSKHAADLAKAEGLAANRRVALARVEVAENVLRAPFSGCLTVAPKGPGAFASPGSVQFHLLDRSSLRLSGSVNAADAALFPVGTELRVEAEASTLQGKVSALVPRVDPASRRIQLLALVPNAGANAALPGSFARAYLLKAPTFLAYRVPSSATIASAEHDVWTVSAGRLARRRLDVATEENEFLIARGGIGEHDDVVAAPDFDMREADPWLGASR